MLNLLIPNRGVIPANFTRSHGICQNLNCQAVVEKPFRFVKLLLPGGTLQTLLCAACMPEACAGTFPEMSLTVVTADPVLPSHSEDSASLVPRFRLVPVSELPVRPRPSPPPELVAKRTRTGRLTFAELCEMEPRLQLLLAEAEAHHRNREPVFCANAV